MIPSRPGETIDPTQLLASLGTAALTGERTLTPALTHVEPELQTSAAEEAVAEAQELVAEPIALSFQDEDVGTLAPQRLAKLVRFRPDGSRFRVTFAPDRIAKAVEPFLSDWRRRAVNARFVVDGKAVRIRPSQPGLAPDGRWISDSISGRRDVVDPPRLAAPEADARRPDDRGRRSGSGSASRSRPSRPRWARPRRTASTTCS